jgi:hypothetical protein
MSDPNPILDPVWFGLVALSCCPVFLGCRIVSCNTVRRVPTKLRAHNQERRGAQDTNCFLFRYHDGLSTDWRHDPCLRELLIFTRR